MAKRKEKRREIKNKTKGVNKILGQKNLRKCVSFFILWMDTGVQSKVTLLGHRTSGRLVITIM